MVKMKDSGIEWIGEIPEDWPLELFKNILWERSEKNYPIKSRERLSLSIDKGVTLYAEKTTNLDRFKEDFDEYKLAYEGDLVMNSMNVISGAVGISKYFGCVSPAYYTYYDKDENHYYARYCDYVFKCQTLRRLLFALGKGIMAIDRGNGKVNTCRLKVAREDLGRLKIPYPKYEVIKDIVNNLDFNCTKIDGLKNDIQKQIEILEQYKKSVITEAVTKGINSNAKMKESGIEWIGEIPEHWDTKKGKYIFTQRNEKGNSIELQLLSPTQKYGVIPQALYDEISGMNSVKLKENTDFNLLKTCHKGDYCISLRSFQGGFEYSKYEGVVSPAYQIFYPTIEIADGYYKYLFKEKNFIEKINSFTLSLRDGKPISYFDFANMYLPLPSAEEQKQIADYLDKKCSSIDSIIFTKKQQLEKLEEYKKSLIFEYVTGKKEIV